MPVQLPQDLTRLRIECAAWFDQHPTLSFAVGEILRCLHEDIWGEDDQGIEVAVADWIREELSMLITNVFEADAYAKKTAAVDNLVIRWRMVLPQIKSRVPYKVH